MSKESQGAPHFKDRNDPEVFFYKLEAYVAANSRDIYVMYKYHYNVDNVDTR